MKGIALHFEIMGRKVRDKVTGFTGVVESISFDLYGCIQAVVRPPVNDRGETVNAQWLDIYRLEVLHNVPVIAVPDYSVTSPISNGEHGCSQKP